MFWLIAVVEVLVAIAMVIGALVGAALLIFGWRHPSRPTLLAAWDACGRAVHASDESGALAYYGVVHAIATDRQGDRKFARTLVLAIREMAAFARSDENLELARRLLDDARAIPIAGDEAVARLLAPGVVDIAIVLSRADPAAAAVALRLVRDTARLLPMGWVHVNAAEDELRTPMEDYRARLCAELASAPDGASTRAALAEFEQFAELGGRLRSDLTGSLESIVPRALAAKDDETLEAALSMLERYVAQLVRHPEAALRKLADDR